MQEHRVQLAIVGGGPAGLAAARAAWEAGLREIVIFERHNEAGGILRQCVHNGFGLAYFGADLTGPEYAERLVTSLPEGPGPRIRTGAFVMGIGPGPELTVLDEAEGLGLWRAQAVVLATGCRERPRGAVNIPGARPSGIYTAGTAQHLMNLQGLLPGKRVVILGSGDIGLIMARRFTLEGAAVRAVVEMLPYPGGLARNVAQCLVDFGIPLLLGRTVVEIHGRERVEGVTVASLDAEGRIQDGTARVLDCDTLVLSVGLLPEIELALAAGAEIDQATGGPAVDGSLLTTVAGVFACGNLLHIHDLADQASLEGELAGGSAAAYILADGRARAGYPTDIRGNLRLVVPQLIDPARENLLHFRVRRPQYRAVLRSGDRIIGRFQVVRPAEAIAVRVPPGVIRPEDGRIAFDLTGEDAEYAAPGTERTGEMVCIVCPLGCALRSEGSEILGAGCKRGVDYARAEMTRPERVLTATVALTRRTMPLPVRSALPLPKGAIQAVLAELYRLKIDPPVAMGDIILPDAAGTGVPVVASRSVR